MNKHLQGDKETVDTKQSLSLISRACPLFSTTFRAIFFARSPWGERRPGFQEPARSLVSLGSLELASTGVRGPGFVGACRELRKAAESSLM